MSLGPHLAELSALNQEIHSVPTADALSALPDSPTDDPTTRLVILYIVHGDHMILELDADDEYWLPHTWYHKDVDIDSSSEAFAALEKCIWCNLARTQISYVPHSQIQSRPTIMLTMATPNSPREISNMEHVGSPLAIFKLPSRRLNWAEYQKYSQATV